MRAFGIGGGVLHDVAVEGSSIERGSMFTRRSQLMVPTARLARCRWPDRVDLVKHGDNGIELTVGSSSRISGSWR